MNNNKQKPFISDDLDIKEQGWASYTLLVKKG